MTPEGKIKAQIKTLLKHYNVYYHMPVQNGMGCPTLDFICCYKGRFIGIEAKAPGKLPTIRQYTTMNDMKQAGAIVVVVSCDNDLLALEGWLKLLR